MVVGHHKLESWGRTFSARNAVGDMASWPSEPLKAALSCWEDICELHTTPLARYFWLEMYGTPIRYSNSDSGASRGEGILSPSSAASIKWLVVRPWFKPIRLGCSIVEIGAGVNGSISHISFMTIPSCAGADTTCTAVIVEFVGRPRSEFSLPWVWMFWMRGGGFRLTFGYEISTLDDLFPTGICMDIMESGSGVIINIIRLLWWEMRTASTILVVLLLFSDTVDVLQPS